MAGVGLLTVRVPFEERIRRGDAEFACHAGRYASAEMRRVNKYLARVNGTLWLRPWNGKHTYPGLFKLSVGAPKQPKLLCLLPAAHCRARSLKPRDRSWR